MAEIVGMWRVQKSCRTASSAKGVRSADRALAVLTAFRQGDAALSLAELAERTGLVKSTIVRLAVSLQRYQLLARLSDGRYRLDAGALRLGTTYQQAFRLQDHVLPLLHSLAVATGETAAFFVRHGEDRICLFRVESASQIRMRVQPGEISPMDGSAVCQVLRRYASDPLNGRRVDAVVLYTSGIADQHTAALATPVFGPDAALVGAIAIAGPATRLTPERAQAVQALLVEAGAELTHVCTVAAVPQQAIADVSCSSHASTEAT